jgi:hypothetical protein
VQPSTSAKLFHRIRLSLLRLATSPGFAQRGHQPAALSDPFAMDWESPFNTNVAAPRKLPGKLSAGAQAGGFTTSSVWLAAPRTNMASAIPVSKGRAIVFGREIRQETD